jgi:predicted RNase H-like HicB family nuclease
MTRAFVSATALGPLSTTFAKYYGTITVGAEGSMLKNVRYTCRLSREDEAVVAVCPEFNVSSFGDTAEEAVESLHEAVTLFLEECQRMGTLEMVLEEAGYRPVASKGQELLVRKWLPPRSLGTRRLESTFA